MLNVAIMLALGFIAVAAVTVIASALRGALAAASDLRGQIASIDARDALVRKLESSGQPEYRPAQVRTVPASAVRRRTSFGQRCVNA